MPSIIIVAATGDEDERPYLRETVPAAIMADPRAAGQLIERMAFALVAAEQAERGSVAARPA